MPPEAASKDDRISSASQQPFEAKEIELLESRHRQLEVDIEALEAVKIAKSKEVGDLEDLVVSRKKQADDLTSTLASLTENVNNAQADLDHRQNQLLEILDKSKGLEHEIAGRQEVSDNLYARIVGQESRVKEVEKEAKDAENHVAIWQKKGEYARSVLEAEEVTIQDNLRLLWEETTNAQGSLESIQRHTTDHQHALETLRDECAAQKAVLIDLHGDVATKHAELRDATHRKDVLEERYDFIMKQSERVNCFFLKTSSLTLQQLEDRKMISSELLGSANLMTQSLSDRFEANKCRRALEHLKAEVGTACVNGFS